MTAKHTQGELTVHIQPPAVRSGDGLDFSLMRGDEVLMLIAPPGIDKKEFRQHLSRLALCWNMHDRLVERLRNLLGRAEDWEIVSDGKHFSLEHSEAYQNARALLAEIDGAKNTGKQERASRFAEMREDEPDRSAKEIHEFIKKNP